MMSSEDGPASVGTPAPHESALGHVRGSARYMDDHPLPANTLHVACGFAPVACGKLSSLNLDAVRNAPGVVDVITAAEVPGGVEVGAVFPGDDLLAEQAIHFHGQSLFAVAARSDRLAQQAIQHARWEIDPAPGITTLAQAIEQNTTVLPSRDWGRRDVTVAGPHVIRGVQQIGGQEHFYLEGQAAIALPQDDGGIMVFSSTQHPDEVQHLVASVLDLPLHMVTVECQRMGGGFGGKESQAAPTACIAAVFAQRLQRPIKYRLPRNADMIQTGKRHPFQWSYDISFDDDGTLLQGDIELDGNCGHSPDLSSGIVERAMFHATNAYAFDAARIRGHHRRLNQVSHTAFRGFGGPQGMLGIEAVMDEIAHVTGQDPLDVRKRNLHRPGADTTPYGQQVEQLVLAPMLEQLEASCDYRQRQAAIQSFNASNEYLKKGLSLTPVQFGISFTTRHLNQAGALVHLYRDGTVQVNHGGTEMGQGLHTKVKQVVADAFGIDLARVRHTPTRTDKVPNASPTAASSGTDMNAFAARNACEALKDRLSDFAQLHLNAPAELLFEHGQLRGKGFSIDFAALIQAAYMERVSLSSTGFYATPEVHFDKELGVGQPFYYFAYGAAASEVVIDTRTGEYRFLRTDILHDVGNSINPALDIGQIEGGFIQGLGWLTCEELVWDDDGLLLANSPANYKIPTADMTPRIFNVELYDAANSKPTVHRSKAVGEPPLMLAISAWCALRQAAAAAGHRLPYLAAPATPEAVFWAVQEARR